MISKFNTGKPHKIIEIEVKKNMNFYLINLKKVEKNCELFKNSSKRENYITINLFLKTHFLTSTLIILGGYPVLNLAKIVKYVFDIQETETKFE